MDLDLAHNSFCKPTNDYSRVIRLPDMPTSDDLLALGFGCEKYDEEQFGAIFLDEAGIWLNSRKWNSSGRTDLLEFFLYLRKRRWDLWLIVQNLDIVDKQVRAAIAEHVVYCSRSDRYQMPIFPKLILNMVTLGLINFLKIPKFHTAICRYGVSHLAPISDTWYYKGEDYFNVYNTTQEFNANYASGNYSILPPAYTLRIRAYHIAKFKAKLALLPSAKPLPCTHNKIMRLTKIYFKKVKAIVAFGSGLFLAFIVCFLLYIFLLKPSSLVQPQKIPISSSTNSNSLPVVDKDDYDKLLKNSKLDAVNYFPKTGYFAYFISGDKKFTTQDLLSAGYLFSFRGTHEVIVKTKSGVIFTITR
jgi:hypothetical protein